MKIAIAIHTYSHIDPMVYFNHIAIISEWTKRYDIVFLGLDRAKVAQARNILVEQALGMNCTHILFLDADHIVDKQMLPYLIESTEVSAVSGLVVKTSDDHEQVGFVNYDDDGMSNAVHLPLNNKCYFVDACAFGCTLIDLSVFAAIEKPYFKDITVRSERDGKLYSQRSDMVFFKELRKLNKKIMIDTRVKVGHVGKSQVFYPDDVHNDSQCKVFQIPVYQKARAIFDVHELKTVYDFGCGRGEKLRMFFSDASIVAIDCDSTRLESLARYNLSASIVCADFSNYVLPRLEKDSLVICADVLEHLENPERLLNQISSGVRCILSTPDSASIKHDVVDNTEHVNHWTKETFLSFLKDNKFNVESLDEYQEILNYKGLIASCIKE